MIINIIININMITIINISIIISSSSRVLSDGGPPVGIAGLRQYSIV